MHQACLPCWPPLQECLYLSLFVCACLQAATGLEWRDMLFFDDESGNVHKVRGVAAGALGH